MISAAFPRFAPRLTLEAFRPRDWRWAALFGLFLAILLVGVVEGQISRGDRGITPINSSGDFLASGITVDVTGDNADDAREKGWREAQRLGWAQLYRKLNGSDGPKLGDSVLDGIVTAIVVEEEQIGPRRYVAKLGVQFDRVRAGQILGVSGRTLRSPPLLVIPVYSIDGIPQVFEQRSAWQRAWAEYNTGQSAIDYVRTGGTGADTAADQRGADRSPRPRLVARDPRPIWRRRRAHANRARRVQLSRWPDQGYFTARFGPDSKLISSFTMTGPSPRRAARHDGKGRGAHGPHLYRCAGVGRAA